MGKIITFYSYKGGVGRSMALANISVVLSSWNYRVLMVDWDLEAPGLEYFFQDYSSLKVTQNKRGVIEILEGICESSNNFGKLDWHNCINEINIDDYKQDIHLITSGKKDNNYYKKVRELNISQIYKNKGGFVIEEIREEWKSEYDFILIDSRTGITDYGGICTIQLPDVLMLIFTASQQGIDGIIDVAKKSSLKRKNMPLDRFSLLNVPVLSRFDSTEEFKISQLWLEKSANSLKGIYENWLPRSIKVIDFLEIAKIPYIPYFSFGEKLPVIEQGTKDSTGIGYSYQTLSSIIANGFENIDSLIENRDSYVKAAKEKLFFKKSRSKKFIPKVFISCSRKDNEKAKNLYNHLLNDGFEPWLDTLNLSPGENWKNVIEREIKNADVFLACLSSNTLSVKGFFNKEIKQALDLYKTRSRSSNYFIPIRFENTNVPDSIYDYQWIDLFEPDGYKILSDSLKKLIEKKEESRALFITSISNLYMEIRSKLKNIKEDVLSSGLIYEMGTLESSFSQWDIILHETDLYVGSKVTSISELINYFNPRVVFSLGFAAGIKNLNIGDIYIPTRAYFWDPLKRYSTEHTEKAQILSYSLEQRARIEAKKENWLTKNDLQTMDVKPKIVFGPVISTTKIFSNVNDLKAVENIDPAIMAIEMEGAVFKDFRQSNQAFQYLHISGIADTITGNNKTDRKPQFLAKNIGAFSFQILENF